MSIYVDFYATLLWNTLICNIILDELGWSSRVFSLWKFISKQQDGVYELQAEWLTILREEIIFNQHRASVFQELAC